MAKALIIFASESDQAVFKPLIDGLKKENIPYEFHICSVHRNPEGLDPLLKGDYSYVISGAGLSAALPGSIASKITKPVFGIPCKGNYEGLDAMLSIMQMPPGIPVLGVGVNRFESILSAAKKLQKPFFEINLVSESHSRAMEKAEAVLREFEIIFKKSDAIEQNAINIEFVQLDEDIPEKDALVIYCPLLLEEDDKAEAALNVLNQSAHGLWVGLNNGVSAALAAIELMNLDGKYSSRIEMFRESLKHKKKK